ncbi:putative sugar O-methyltransferase [Parasphingorhabdus sp.]|uniref:putative sugar O-methyltransferase n=1 Tax=Parasphingorhabdus sp. TaxID=2709688 RepID=UPI002F95CD55
MQLNELAHYYLNAKDVIKQTVDALPENEVSGVSEMWEAFFANRTRQEEFDGILNMLNGRYDSTSGVALKIKDEDKEIYSRLYSAVFEGTKIPDCSMFGNPDVLKVGEIYSYASYLQNYSRNRDLIPFCKERFRRPIHVLEIGAGYGGMAEQLISAGIVDSYTIIDLPNNLVLSSTYLKAVFESSYEFNICGPLLHSKALNFIVPQQLQDLAEKKFDLVLNCDSLGEMPASVASTYISFISEALSEDGIFYSKNGHRRSVGTTEKVTDYGYDRFDLLKIEPTQVPSLVFDHHSHVLYLKKKSANGSVSVSGTLFDTISELFRSGIHYEISSILKGVANNDLNAEQEKFLTYVKDIYGKGIIDLKIKFSDAGLQAAVDYLHGIELFNLGKKAAAKLKLADYVPQSRSAVAEAIARFVLMQIDKAYLADQNYTNGVRTEFLLKTMKLDLHNPVQRLALFKIRQYNVRLVTRPFTKGDIPAAVKVKNLIMKYLR